MPFAKSLLKLLGERQKWNDANFSRFLSTFFTFFRSSNFPLLCSLGLFHLIQPFQLLNTSSNIFRWFSLLDAYCSSYVKICASQLIQNADSNEMNIHISFIHKNGIIFWVRVLTTHHINSSKTRSFVCATILITVSLCMCIFFRPKFLFRFGTLLLEIMLFPFSFSSFSGRFQIVHTSSAKQSVCLFIVQFSSLMHPFQPPSIWNVDS